MTVKEAYLHGREHLAALGSREAAIEAEMLLRFVLGVDRARLYTHWDGPLPAAAWARYRSLLEERGAGRPVHYIVGEREFMGLAFAVDERVMIPRPETELLVEYAAARLRDRAEPLLADVGTGSGCVAVSLACLLPAARVYATDVSAGALEVAGANAARHGVAQRVVLVQGDLLAALPDVVRGRLDAVLSNPPYVPAAQAHGLPREIRDFEPQGAIVAPDDGTGFHRQLVATSPEWLAPGGVLALEVGAGQAEVVTALLEQAGRYGARGIERDRAGIGRVVWGVVEK
jgi:release factor glutamine methyltransferase